MGFTIFVLMLILFGDILMLMIICLLMTGIIWGCSASETQNLISVCLSFKKPMLKLIKDMMFSRRSACLNIILEI